MRSSKKFIIEKVPLPYVMKDYPKDFGRMPVLYLEFLENKNKIRQDCVGKDYIPPERLSFKKYRPKYSYELAPRASRPSGASGDVERPERPERIERVEGTERVEGSQGGSPASVASSDQDGASERSERSEEQSDEEFHERVKADFYKREGVSKSPEPIEAEEDEGSERGAESIVSAQEPKPLSSKDKLLRFLKKKDHSFTQKYTTPHKTNVPLEPVKPLQTSTNRPMSQTRRLPTLSELEQQNKVHIKKETIDVARFNTGDEDAKRQLLFKFDILKMSYKNTKVDIPKFTIYDNYEVMSRSYDDVLRRLSLTKSVDTYKNYLLYGFMGLEFLLGKFLKLDMEGFTTEQITKMNSYEHLLIELGEKNYVPTAKKWPVEVRLLGIVVINTAFFVVTRSLFKGAGASILKAVNDMTIPVNPPSGGKKKMQGPSIDLDNLPV